MHRSKADDRQNPPHLQPGLRARPGERRAAHGRRRRSRWRGAGTASSSTRPTAATRIPSVEYPARETSHGVEIRRLPFVLVRQEEPSSSALLGTLTFMLQCVLRRPVHAATRRHLLQHVAAADRAVAALAGDAPPRADRLLGDGPEPRSAHRAWARSSPTSFTARVLERVNRLHPASIVAGRRARPLHGRPPATRAA